MKINTKNAKAELCPDFLLESLSKCAVALSHSYFPSPSTINQPNRLIKPSSFGSQIILGSSSQGFWRPVSAPKVTSRNPTQQRTPK